MLRGVGDLGDTRLDGRGLIGRPPPGQFCAQGVAGALDRGQRLMGQYALGHRSKHLGGNFRG
jgi:hypothetical protein